MELTQYPNGLVIQTPKPAPVKIHAIFGQRLDFLELGAHEDYWQPIAQDIHARLMRNPTEPILFGGYDWRRTGQNQNYDHILKAGDGRDFELTMKVNQTIRAYHPNLISIEYPGKVMTLWQGDIDQIERPWINAAEDIGPLNTDQLQRLINALTPTRLHIKTDYLTEEPITLSEYGLDPRLPMHHPAQWSRTRTRANVHNVGSTLYIHSMKADVLIRNYNKTEECQAKRTDLPQDIYTLSPNIAKAAIETRLKGDGHHWYHRLEIEYKRQWLHDHRINSLAMLKQTIKNGQIWRTGLEHADIIEPTDTNSTRCRLADWWRQLKDSWQPGDTKPTEPKPPQDWETLAKQRASLDGKIAAIHEHETGEAIAPDQITPNFLAQKAQIAIEQTYQKFKEKRDEYADRIRQWINFHKPNCQILGLCYSQPDWRNETWQGRLTTTAAAWPPTG